MPKFLMQATFTPDGVKNLIEQGGTKRQEQLQGLAQSLGGTLEAVYFSPQRNEGFVILDLPDGQRINLAGTLMAVNAGGFVQIKAQPVLTARELDSAVERARSIKVPGK
jgi:uncharacterized protein with GYD domain